MDHRLRTLGAGFVIPGKSSVVHDPPEGTFDRPPLVLWFEASLVGFFGDDFNGDVVFGALLDDALLVSAVDPCLADAGLGGCDLVNQIATADGVLDACRSHDEGQNETQHVCSNMTFAAFDAFAGVDALRRFRHVGGSLHALGVEDRCCGCSACLAARRACPRSVS